MSTERKFREFTDLEHAIPSIKSYPVPFSVLCDGSQRHVEVACCEGSIRNALAGTNFGGHDSDRIFLALPVPNEKPAA